MADVRWLDDEEMAAWRAFLITSALLNRRLDAALREDVGLSHLQYEILARLEAAPEGAIRMTELADSVQNTKSGLTYQVTQLETAGLAIRRSCPSDVRGVTAVITAAGRRMLRRAAPNHVATVRELFIDVLSREELQALAAGFGRAAQGMREA